MPTLSPRALLATGTLAALASLAALPAQAATVTATATGGLSLIAITGDASGLTFTPADLVSESITRSGIATGFKDTFVGYLFDPLALGTGLDVFLEATIDGSASGVGTGSSVQSSATATSLINIFNGGPGTVEIVLGFSYAVETLVAATPGPLLLNDALAEASFSLGIDGVNEEFFFSFSDLAGGPDDDLLAGTFQRTLALAAGQVVFVDLSTSAFGIAEVAVVPVPAAAWLLLSAIGTGFVTRRRIA